MTATGTNVSSAVQIIHQTENRVNFGPTNQRSPPILIDTLLAKLHAMNIGTPINRFDDKTAMTRIFASNKFDL